jgi:hypothetical protein
LLAAATSGGDTAQTGGGVFLVAQNTSGGSLTVQVATPRKIDGDLDIADRTFTIAATSGLSFIPLVDLYRDPATGRAAITYPGGVASGALKVAVVRMSTS